MSTWSEDREKRLVDRFGEKIKGLGVRCQSSLLESDFISLDEVKAAIESGELTCRGKYRGKKLRNFGVKSFYELCEFLGATPSPTPPVNLSKIVSFLEDYGYEVRYVGNPRRKVNG